MQTEKLLEIAKDIVLNSGNIIMNIYKQQTYEVEEKDDKSPVTKADKEASDFICRELFIKTSIPVLSEESYVGYDIRKNWSCYWLVDPLDGTKDFILKNDEFTINVALIYNSEPIIGIVYAPAKEELFYAIKDGGAFYYDRKSTFKMPIYKPITLIAGVSRLHDSEDTRKFLKLNNINDVIRIGSSLKLCYLARGDISIYPRYVGSKEWDIAAGHLIIKESQCFIKDLKTDKEPEYSKVNIKNNHFIAYSERINLRDLITIW